MRNKSFEKKEISNSGLKFRILFMQYFEEKLYSNFANFLDITNVPNCVIILFDINKENIQFLYKNISVNTYVQLKNFEI